MFKTILVHLAGDERDAATLQTALSVARRFDAHLSCMHIRPSVEVMASHASGVDMGTGGAIAEAFAIFKEMDEKALKHAQDAFHSFVLKEKLSIAEAPATASLSASWRDMKGFAPDILIAAARHHDLMIVGARGGKDTSLSTTDLGDILLECGKPILIAGTAPLHQAWDRMAIAWKDTAESARALNAAMPMLEQTYEVSVLSVAEQDRAALPCLNTSDSVCGLLRWHGLHPTSHLLLPEGRSVFETIIEEAVTRRADILVMGGFGHNRLREVVFGGFTQSVLQKNPLPVLIFH